MIRFAGLLAVCHTPAEADVIYDYTGPDFTEFIGVYACPDVCRITGSFTVASALPASTLVNQVLPSWYSFTDGIHVFNPTTVEEVFSFLIRTDANGLPELWDITLETNSSAAAPPQRALGTMWGTLERDISNQTSILDVQPGGSAACYNCGPGSWKVRTDDTGSDDTGTVPEPAALRLWGAAGLGLSRRLARRRSP